MNLNLHEQVCQSFYLYLHFLFFTGITDDDLRETAYEILLAAAGASGYASLLIKKCSLSLIDIYINGALLFCHLPVLFWSLYK